MCEQLLPTTLNRLCSPIQTPSLTAAQHKTYRTHGQGSPHTCKQPSVPVATPRPNPPPTAVPPPPPLLSTHRAVGRLCEQARPAQQLLGQVSLHLAQEGLPLGGLLGADAPHVLRQAHRLREAGEAGGGGAQVYRRCREGARGAEGGEAGAQARMSLDNTWCS